MSFVATILWLVMKEGAKLCAAGIAIGDRRSARHRAIAVQRAPRRHVRRSGHLRLRRAPGRRRNVVGLLRAHPARTPSRSAHRAAISDAEPPHHEAQPTAVLATQDIEPERPPHQLGPFICARSGSAGAAPALVGFDGGIYVRGIGPHAAATSAAGHAERGARTRFTPAAASNTAGHSSSSGGPKRSAWSSAQRPALRPPAPRRREISSEFQASDETTAWSRHRRFHRYCPENLSTCRTSRFSSIFLRRIVGPVFMRVNSKCAHQARPPLLGGGLNVVKSSRRRRRASADALRVFALLKTNYFVLQRQS
jgi:hypothetical protein